MKRLFCGLLVALLFLTSANVQFVGNAEAGVVSKLGKAYAAAKIMKASVLAVRYVKQVQKLSGLKISRAQISLLKDCFKSVKCVTFKSNPQQFVGTARMNAINQWEARTGMKWPTYAKDVYSRSGKILRRAGDKLDAHHLIPKQIGGPHQWWNMHPVPAPQHQSIVHAAESFLRQLTSIYRG